MNEASFLKEIGISGLVDMAIMSIIIYALIIWFKRSKAVFVLIGFFIFGIIYMMAREFNLQLVANVFRGFFAVILIALIVIFQEEIKHLFERIAVWSLHRGIKRQQVMHLSRHESEVVVRTVYDLAQEKVGALIVLKGKDTIARHINGGIDLNGELSEAVLKSLFDPLSLGHDGAVLIENDRILQFGTHLPLSKDLRKLQTGSGTRHAAALGLSELTDALCIIVSEERGVVSVTRYGEIELVSDAEKLNLILERFFDETAPLTPNTAWHDLLTKNVREKLLSVMLTTGLWFFYVHESRLTYRSFMVPVEYTNLPESVSVEEIKPGAVEVMLSGPRRHFYFTKRNRIKLIVNMVDVKEGFQTKTIQRSNLHLPAQLDLEAIVPSKIKIVAKPRHD